MSWVLYDDTLSTNFLIHNSASVSLTLHELDTATVNIVGTVAVDDAVRVVESVSGTVIFRGYIKNIDEDPVTKIKTLTLIETANELKDHIVESGGSRKFVVTSSTVQAIVDTIITGTGWTRGTTDTTAVTTVAFSNINSLAALNKLLYDMYGYEIWFVTTVSTKTVYWGTVRTVRGTVTYLKKIQTGDSNNRGITDITVYGSDDSIYGSYSTGTTPKKERLYRNRSCKSSSECTKIATTLVNDFKNPRNRYTLYLNPNVFTYQPCDQITVDTVNYIVRDVTYTPIETRIGIGSYELSYSDLNSSTLEEITGSIASLVDAQWSGGTTNLAANSASYTDFSWNITDKDLISEAKIDVKIGSFAKAASVSSNTGTLSDISTIDSTADTTSSSYIATGGTTIASTSISIPDGCQFAFLGFTADMWSVGSNGWECYIQYSLNGTSWVSCPSWFIGYQGDADYANKIPFSLYGLIPGIDPADSTTLYVRARAYADVSSTLRLYSYGRLAVQAVSRHLHSVSTTYDKTSTGTPPSTVLVKVNTATEFTLTPSTPVDITSSLVDGKNTIQIRTPSGSGNQCSVSPTVAYKTLGQSS